MTWASFILYSMRPRLFVIFPLVHCSQLMGHKEKKFSGETQQPQRTFAILTSSLRHSLVKS